MSFVRYAALAAGGISLLAPLVVAQPLIQITPDTISVGSVGTSFTVDVEIADYEDLRGFSIELLYNQAAIQHVSLVQGNVFTAGGGPGGLFLASGSNAEQGYILADGARIGGGGSSGSSARLFRISFQTVGPGATNLFFGQILLRDSENQPLPFDVAEGLVAVVSPVPVDVHTRLINPGDHDEDHLPMGMTGMGIQVLDAGTAVRGKLTAARFGSAPPGGSGAPFSDPDGVLERLGVGESYWELTSSLAGEYHLRPSYSFAGIDGPKNPYSYRVARRDLSAGDEDEWWVLPQSWTAVDNETQEVYLDAPPGVVGAGQYALVFNDPISTEGSSEQRAGLALVVYPNPTTSTMSVRFSLPPGASGQIVVYDVMARRMKSPTRDHPLWGEGEVELHLSLLPPGTYLVVLETSVGRAVRRATVVR